MKRSEFKAFLLVLLILHQPGLKADDTAQSNSDTSSTPSAPSKPTQAELDAQDKARQTKYDNLVLIGSYLQIGMGLVSGGMTCYCQNAPDQDPTNQYETALDVASRHRVQLLQERDELLSSGEVVAFDIADVEDSLFTEQSRLLDLDVTIQLRQADLNRIMRLSEEIGQSAGNMNALYQTYLNNLRTYRRCKWPKRGAAGANVLVNVGTTTLDGINMVETRKYRLFDVAVFTFDVLSLFYSFWDFAASVSPKCANFYPDARKAIGYAMPALAAIKATVAYYKTHYIDTHSRRLEEVESQELSTIASFYSDSLMINLDRAIGPLNASKAIDMSTKLESFFESKFGKDLFVDIRRLNCSSIFTSPQNLTGDNLDQELKDLFPDTNQITRNILNYLIIDWFYVPVLETLQVNGTIVEMVAKSLTKSSMIFNLDMDEVTQEYYIHIYTQAQANNATFAEDEMWEVANEAALDFYLLRQNMLYDAYLTTLNDSSLDTEAGYDDISDLFYKNLARISNASSINPTIMQNLTATKEVESFREQLKNVMLNTTITPDIFFPPGVFGPSSPPQTCRLEPRQDDPSQETPPEDPNDFFDDMIDKWNQDVTNEPKLTDIANKLKNNPGSGISCPCEVPTDPYQPIDPTEPGGGGDDGTDNTYKVKEPTMEPVTTHLPLPEIVLNPQEYIKIISDPLGPIKNPNLFEVFPRLPAPTPPSLGVFGVFADIFRFVEESLIMVATGYVLGGIAEVAAGVTEVAEATTAGAEVGLETGVETGVKTGLDAGLDITLDTGADVSLDTTMDTTVDAGLKTSLEEGSELSNIMLDSAKQVATKNVYILSEEYSQLSETVQQLIQKVEQLSIESPESLEYVGTLAERNAAQKLLENLGLEVQQAQKTENELAAIRAAQTVRRLLADDEEESNIEGRLAKVLSLNNRSEAENLQFYHAFHSAIIQPFQHSLSEGSSPLEMLANMTSRLNTLPNSVEYQKLITSQTGNDHQTASQIFSQVNEYQQKTQYKQVYNYFNYIQSQANLSTTRRRMLTEGGDENVFYYYNLSAQTFGELVKTLTFFVSNLNTDQWEDLVDQINGTITTYLSTTLTNTSIVIQNSTSTSQIIYKLKEEQEETENFKGIRFIYEDLDSNATDKKIQLWFANMTSAIKDDLSTQVNQTIRNTFEIASKADLSGLISSISITQGDGSSSYGIVSAFKVLQTDQNYYTLNFDASESYSLWGDSLTYTWDFGDGTNLTRGVELFNVSHTYTKAGNYTIRLKVQDIYGHSAISQTPSTITILYNMISWPVASGSSFYIGSKSNVWMVITGNSYVPITPFLNGANKATLFEISSTATQNVFTLNALGVEGADNGNFLGMWGYPTVSKASLQASFLPATNTYPSYALWTILPLADDPGYFSIQQGSSYLTISGELQKKFDASTCAFTFTSGTGQSQSQLMGKLVDFGAQPISSIQIVNKIDSSSANDQVKITSPGDSDSLFNFIPYNNTGYYTIADELLQDELLTAPGKGQTLFFETSPIPVSDQLWSMHLASSPYLSLSTKADQDLCLNYDLSHNLISMASCSAQDTGLCYDRYGRFIYKPSCKTMLDKICCNALLLLVPFVGKKLYHDSCHLCSSGKYYCQSVYNQDKLIVESIFFPLEKCTPEKGLSATNSWFLNRIDAATLQDTYMSDVQAHAFSTKNIKLWNIGYQQYLCQNKGAYPYMCDSPIAPLNVLTVGTHAEIDVPSASQVGYYIVGSGKNAGYYVVGPYGEDNARVFSLTIDTNHGHFWQVIKRGYNVFNLRYAWGFSTPRCAAPVKNDPRDPSQILINFLPCDPLDRNQLWYFESI